MSGHSNWKPKRSAADATSLSESQSQKVGAQEPRRPNSDAYDESRFRSRIERRAKKVPLPKQKLIQWEIWCSVHRIHFQTLVEDALDLYMQQYEIFGSLGAQEPTINDLTDRSTDEETNISSSSSSLFPIGSPGAQLTPAEAKERELLAFYSDRTGNPLKPRDREAFAQGNADFAGVADLPEPAIKFGIMQSILLCKSRVNSFSYCLGAIHQAAEEGVSAEVAQLYERTFTVRMDAKRNPAFGGSGTFSSDAYEQYFSKLRKATVTEQPTLPTSGGELKEFKK
jgi:hypothetical protein